MAEVSFDHRAILIDDKRQLILSAALHYPRSTPEMWHYLMKMSKDAQLNAVETYVFWNLHERNRGEYDFSGRLDLKSWCELAQKLGLNVILRIGPYICAESNYGGLPFWLRDIPGIRMRTHNEPFQKEMEKWVRHLCEYLEPLFAPKGGPIILFQLENEYSLIRQNYSSEGERYLKWCVELGNSLNLGIPLIMCVGSAKGALETLNAFEAHKLIQPFFNEHPNHPALWTECWTGWYDVFGYPHHTRSAENLSYAVARFIAAGGSGVNYYPFHGGTNFDREGMYLQATSYDYDAPIDEQGFPTPKYCQITKLNYYLQKYGDLLLSLERPQVQSLGNEKYAFIYRDKHHSLVFLSNDTASDSLVNFEGQNFILGAKSVMLIGDGRVIMNTGDLCYSCVNYCSAEVKRIGSLSFSFREEPLPEKWSDLFKAPQILEKPVEQLQFTKDETDYCWYSAAFKVSLDSPVDGKLEIRGIADLVHIFIDGKYHQSTKAPLEEERGCLKGEGFTQTFWLKLLPGKHEISLLCCALGLIKGDWMIGQENMAEERKGIWGSVLWNEAPITELWRIQPGLMGEKDQLFEEVGSAFEWDNNSHAGVDRPLTWWQADFDKPPGDDPLLLDLNGMKKGMAWVNGKCLGRYWLVKAHEQTNWFPDAPAKPEQTGMPTQRYYNIPFEWITGKNNRLVLFEEMGGDPHQVAICRKVWMKFCIHKIS